MDTSVDETLDQLLEQIVTFLQDGKLEEAESVAQDAYNFGQTISASTFQEWRSKCVGALKGNLFYHKSASWIDMNPNLAVKEDSFGIQQLSAVVRCFAALDARKDVLEQLILINCLIQTTPSRWLECSELCMAENELQLASRCCGNGIRCIMSDTQATPILNSSDQRLLLSLWFQRSRLFELQDRTSDSMASISIYARLSAEFQQLNAKMTHPSHHTIVHEPLQSMAHKKLAEKQQKRQTAI